MAIERLKDSLMACMFCSECMGKGPAVPFMDATFFTPEWTCPEKDALKFTSYTARGQQYVAREIVYGGMKIDEDVVKIFNACTNCGICGTLCDIPLHDTVMAMREEIYENAYNFLSDKSKEINNNISEKHNAFGSINSKRTWWAREFNLPDRGDILYFSGCHTSWRHPSISNAVVSILQNAGINISYLGENEWCCGFPCWSHGNIKTKEDMARHNVNEIIKSGAKTVLFNCASCYRTFKMVYPEIVGKLPFDTIHITSLLKDMIKEDKIKLENTLDINATYHDPCLLIRGHLGEGNDMYDEPREIIEHIPGLKFTEMKRNKQWAYCCGDGGTVVSSSYPEVRDYISGERLHEAKETAETLLTVCPHCIESFSLSAIKNKIDIEIKDLTEVVAEVMGVISP